MSCLAGSGSGRSASGLWVLASFLLHSHTGQVSKGCAPLIGYATILSIESQEVTMMNVASALGMSASHLPLLFMTLLAYDFCLCDICRAAGILRHHRGRTLSLTRGPAGLCLPFDTNHFNSTLIAVTFVTFSVCG